MLQTGTECRCTDSASTLEDVDDEGVQVLGMAFHIVHQREVDQPAVANEELYMC
jgi:hypothetical protein